MGETLREVAQASPRYTTRPIVSAQQKLLRDVRQRWGDTLQKNLEVGECLIQLRLRKTYWKLNLYNLPMGYSWGKRLMKIAADQRIRANLEIMPDARTALHQIALLTDQQFCASKRAANHPFKLYETRSHRLAATRSGREHTREGGRHVGN